LVSMPDEVLVGVTAHDSSDALGGRSCMPEYGRTHVFKIRPNQEIDGRSRDIVDKVGGRVLFKEEISLEDLHRKIKEGYVFRQTMITTQYSYKQYVQEKDDSTVFLYLIKPSGQIKFYSEEMRTVPG